ncbi:MAG: DUF6146 family protein [Bacteroidales bacterium]|jgi:hypothetical protein|nr:DUF6146 family protein [Bacteroidales bacterium]
MKKLLCLTLLMVGFLTTDHIFAQEEKQEVSGIEINSEDSIEYELLIFDPGFDNYLATVPHPKDHYSNDYYRNWNIQYCSEWNKRHQNPFKYGDFYETHIDYDPSVDYGIDFNYKLYYYFQYIEDKYGIVLIKRKGK